MSKEINIDTNNLCTTEDAFDQFQAVSYIEDDDFITLSDIAPPEDVAPDLSTDMIEIPYDNEVVLSSNQEEQIYEVNSKPDSGTELADLPAVFSDQNTTVLQSLGEIPSNVTERPGVQNESELASKPKRGRKRKNAGNTVVTSTTNESDNMVTQENNQINENLTLSKPKTPGRRGRKTKNSQNSLSLNGSQSHTRDEQTAETTQQNSVRKTSGRRGRPRKMPLEETLTNTTSQQPINENKLSSDMSNNGFNKTDDLSLNNLSNKAPAKRERRKQIRPEETASIEMQHDPVENTDKLDQVSASESKILEMKSSGKHSKWVVKRSPGKRGRPKRLPPEEITVDKVEKTISDNILLTETNIPEDDEGDDMSLSRLKATLDSNVTTLETNVTDNLNSDIEINDTPMTDDKIEIEIQINDSEANALIDVGGIEDIKVDDNPTKRNYKTPAMPDFEYDIDNVIKETIKSENEHIEIKSDTDVLDESYLVEDTSKRPVRRKTKQSLHYDEGSDEDPFANVELSDDEPSSRRKGKKYYSDDEYIPGNKRGKASSSEDVSDSDIDDLEAITTYNKKKRIRNSISQSKSPKKKSKNTDQSKIIPNVTTIAPSVDGTDDDIEVCLQSSVIKASDDANQIGWGATSEFENFIAQKIHGTDLKIKKVSSAEPTQSLEIPVLDANEAKKYVEMCTQTSSIQKKAMGVQTTTQHDVPMKDNITLTSEQSEKACEFLKSVVKTTSELGQLMTQKSEDFILKKINTDHVTDTFKMDYCVKKSFLLFKLAKHNLMQMEEDLAKQYEEFLKNNGLESCREQQLKIEPKGGPKTADSDSDCEIVETPVQVKQVKPKFNPKTVFLNKELSIKIAKKPSATENKKTKEKLNIKGRHTVWISDSVMVKKVKPTQSFLAQDSRNKKPPDCVTEEMVSDFFKEYYRQQVQTICAPFTSTEWRIMHRNYVCCYFFDKSDTFSDTSTSLPSNDELYSNERDNDDTLDNKDVDSAKSLNKSNISHPATLFSLCTQTLKKYLHPSSVNVKENYDKICDTITDLKKQKEKPESLFRLCVNSLINSFKNMSNDNSQMQHENEFHEQATPQILVNSPNIKTDDCSSTMSDILPEIDYDDDSFLKASEIQHEIDYEDHNSCKSQKILPLQTLCHRTILNLFSSIEKKKVSILTVIKQEVNANFTVNGNISNTSYDNFDEIIIAPKRGDQLIEKHVKSLFSFCVDTIQYHQMAMETKQCEFVEENLPTNAALYSPECLKHISFENVIFHLYKKSGFDQILASDSKLPETKSVYKVKRLASICFGIISKVTSGNDKDCIDKAAVEELTINSVNTMSEEAFHNILDTCLDTEENTEYLADEETNFYNEDEFHGDFHDYEEDNPIEDNNWVTRVQMKELKSCFVPAKVNSAGKQIQQDEEYTVTPEEQPVIAKIKLEPFEEVAETVVDSSIVKTEPTHNLDEMTVIPDSIITKREHIEPAVDPLPRRGSSNYDVDIFESFVSSNTMMHALTEFSSTSDDIFSQSAVRVRRQYDPDSDNENHENDLNMSLLVPQTFEPLNVENAKGNLMESSSDDDSKRPSKKKPERRGRPRGKKAETKLNNKDAAKEKPPPPPPVNEVAKLTRRMRDRIRQEEKKVQSSDSEPENLPLNTRKDKDRKDGETLKSKGNKPTDHEIQCNNVDSTEQIDYSANKIENFKKFTGFTAVDQNEITSYQKYVKFVYDKIMPKVISETENNQTKADTSKAEDAHAKVNENNDRSSPLINPDEPVEMLECVPIISMFGDDDDVKQCKKIRNKGKSKRKVDENKTEILEKVKKSEEKKVEKEKPICTERHGWQCYPLDKQDIKLNQKPAIILEKLPESFVETYFQYQNITGISKEDEEVDRLINLQSLNRSSIVKDGKSKTKTKTKVASGEPSEQADGSGLVSPANSENYDELTPSEDEQNVDDEIPPLVPLRPATENNLAKSSLMNDNESDSDAPISNIKQEPKDNTQEMDTGTKKKSKTSSKVPENPENLMLTADKMMNKELNLLHAPVVLKDEVPETATKGSATRHKHKSGLRSHSTRDRIKNEDDSSSEEEKQWVNTKEKLLKRLGKKQDTASVDDAKRAKLVSEFIERRGDAPESRKRGRGGGRCRRRSSKKMLEQEKQLRVLSKELFGESSDGTCGRRAMFSQSYFKGRRNIRKVIDKKSLTRSTVIANMEEFERKCRLNQRQNRLREELGCEEGVNVLVINGEVCLEYDFEEQQPVVSVHPFFTKVMKAHQYEGVKFMWDACFESLEKIESGHQGGGCILAHCMGLGKTLQVLALLHTVLTHPRVGMQRVLVCCPLSTVLNWVDEIHKWIGPVTDNIKVFELSKLKKTYERAYQLEDWYSGGGIFIIGYELFRSLSTLDPVLDDIRPTIVNKIRTALLDPGPDIIVCDEGHLLKNDCSVLAVAMSRVVTKRRIVLTGTPMQNNLREYYCMVNFVKPNLLGTYSEYSNRFENPIMNGQHRDSQKDDIKLMKQRTHILHKVLEGCLQRQEASVLYPYLPKKHEYTVLISLTKCQWDLYKHYLQNYAKQSKQSILKDFHILQKIWSHPQVLHNFQMRTRDESGNKIKPEKLEDDLATEDLTATEDIKPSDTEVWWLQYLEGGKMLDNLNSSNKFLVVFRILDECIKLGDKVLIFSTSLITMDSLEFFLRKINKWSLGQEYYRLDGSVPAEVRQKWCREFNAENNLKTKLFLISTRAGSLGLNMVAANRVIILDTSWNPAHDIQSIFRVYRFGQKKDCYIYRLVALGTMEQKIYERSVTKQAVACRVVDEQQIDRHYNMAELTELYGYDETGVGVVSGVAVGVTDVALLRVARNAALHAVHEHDSLLRGSSEQGLPEHERAAAWMQFQEEHAHKQMQNQLTSSFTLQIPMTQNTQFNPTTHMLQIPLKRTIDGTPSIQLPQVKVEDTSKDTEYKPKPKPKKVKGKGRKCRIPVENDEQPATNSATLPVDDTIVKKIMNILIKHNFTNHQGPKGIADLVSNVRKIVAYGRVPEGSFNKELTESIANVLLGKEPPMPALTNINQPDSIETPPPPPPGRQHRGRGRSRKQKDSPSTSKDFENELQEILPETSQEPEESGGRKRRKAALAAERHLDSIIDDPVIDLDEDDDWQGGSDVDAPAVTVPEQTTETQIKKENNEKSINKEKGQKETEQQLNTEINSILLSDDDEPPPDKQPDNAKTTANKKTEKAKEEEVVPLHPSLLSNKNFIKIVAHTYLEGNPMLDEDAATLAAQYSTLKALKELESTGKAVDSGPIYDIAIKVLGIDVLKKLHKSNPQLKKEKTTDKPAERTIKSEATPETKPKSTPRPRFKAKGISELMASPTPPAPQIPPPQMPTLGVGTTTTRFTVAASSSRSATPTVVPVGLFKRSINILPDEPEESILPDDDDVHIVSDPVPAPGDHHRIPPGIKPNAKPLILNSVLATQNLSSLHLPTRKERNLGKTIEISAGRVIMTQSAPMVSTPAITANVQTSVADPIPSAMTSSRNDTICLDSDEEVAPDPVATRTKRVALKSTAKKQTAPEVVPVSLTAANPQLNEMQSMPPFNMTYDPTQPMQLGQSSLLNLNQIKQLPPNKNYVVIPASQINKLTQLPKGTIPPMGHRLTPVGAGNHTITSQGLLLNAASQNMNYVNSMTSNPQNFNTMSMPQNLNSIPQMHMMSQMSTMQQVNTMQQMNTVPQLNTIHMNTAPQMSAEPQNTNVTNSESTPPTKSAPAGKKKTVCKPGDILRITKTGQVQILDSTDVPVVDDPPPSTSKTKTKKSERAVTSTNVDDVLIKTRRSQRARKISSSSSSSSSSSRAASPDNPLSIFKDIVHIKSIEDILDSSKSDSTNDSKASIDKQSITPSKERMIGNTLITKSLKNSTPAKAAPSNVTITSSKDKVTKQITKTDTILKKLNNILAPEKKTSQSKQASKSKTNAIFDSVDLTDLDAPSTSNKSKNTVLSGKSDSKSKNVVNQSVKVDKKKEPSKIVGTSKNIIISGNGKGTTMALVDQSANKSIRVTNVEKIAPAFKWSDVKKRSSTTTDTNAAKKKKTEPMTLKDFDIDDIDDIIELD